MCKYPLYHLYHTTPYCDDLYPTAPYCKYLIPNKNYYIKVFTYNINTACPFPYNTCLEVQRLITKFV